MQLFIKDDTGKLVATFDGVRFYHGLDVRQEELAFLLWKLSIRLMGVGTGSGGFGFTNPVASTGPDDIEGGTP